MVAQKIVHPSLIDFGPRGSNEGETLYMQEVIVALDAPDARILLAGLRFLCTYYSKYWL